MESRLPTSGLFLLIIFNSLYKTKTNVPVGDNMNDDLKIAERYLFVDLAIKNLELDLQHVENDPFKKDNVPEENTGAVFV